MRKHPDELHAPDTIGQRAADAVAGSVGSWPFIIGQSVILSAWIVWNGYFAVQYFAGYAFDPMPFILMNLFLSLQAAYTGPLVMISQRRQDEKAHKEAHKDYEVDRRVAVMLEELHQKVDRLGSFAVHGEAQPSPDPGELDTLRAHLKDLGF